MPSHRPASGSWLAARLCPEPLQRPHWTGLSGLGRHAFPQPNERGAGNGSSSPAANQRENGAWAGASDCNLYWKVKIILCIYSSSPNPGIIEKGRIFSLNLQYAKLSFYRLKRGVHESIRYLSSSSSSGSGISMSCSIVSVFP